MAVALTSFIQPMLVSQKPQLRRIETPSFDASVTQSNQPNHPSFYTTPSVSHSNPTPAPSDSETSESSDFRLSSCSQSNDDDVLDTYFDIRLVGEGTKCTVLDSDCTSSDHEHSVSTSQCRYCYADIRREDNVSQCYCSGTLCKDCLVKELQLTYSKRQELKCTVCKSEYDVDTEFAFNIRKHCRSLCKSIIHCGLKDEQYLLDSAGGKIGFVLVILGINTWILSTSLLFAFPPDGCPVALYYMVSIFDLAVGLATLWFIVKCRYLSPLLLSTMYFARFLYVLLGWTVDFMHIHTFHVVQSNHIAILIYFLVFSLLAAVAIGVCWLADFYRQFRKYKVDHGRLVLRKNDIKIEVYDLICAADECDEF